MQKGFELGSDITWDSEERNGEEGREMPIVLEDRVGSWEEGCSVGDDIACESHLYLKGVGDVERG